MGFKDKLATFLSVFDQIGPPILAAAGVPPALIPIIAHGVKDVEQAAATRPVPLSGAEKKALVLDGLRTGIDGANAVHPGAIDPNVTALASRGIDLAVQTVNAIHKQPIT